MTGKAITLASNSTFSYPVYYLLKNNKLCSGALIYLQKSPSFSRSQPWNNILRSSIKMRHARRTIHSNNEGSLSAFQREKGGKRIRQQQGRYCQDGRQQNNRLQKLG